MIIKYPYQKNIFTLKDIEDKFKNLKKYSVNYLYNKDNSIELISYLFTYDINSLNISNYYEEKEYKNIGLIIKIIY